MTIQTDSFDGARIVTGKAASPNEEAVERALRPKHLAEYVGQAKIREQLEIFVTAARGRGLHTCPQFAFAQFHRIIARVLDLPPEQKVLCGMSLGYPDPAATVNRFRTDREPVQVFATLLGFDDA